MNQLSRYFNVLALFVLLAGIQGSYAAADDHADIKAEITKRHDEAVKRLQDWIAQVSIAAEDRGYPEGAEYMAKLARDAGFQQATVINTEENRACSRRSTQVRRKPSGSISCTM